MNTPTPLDDTAQRIIVALALLKDAHYSGSNVPELNAMRELLIAVADNQIELSDEMVRTLTFLQAVYPGMRK